MAFDASMVARSRIRYLLYRFRTAAEGGASAPDDAEARAVREHFEYDKFFVDWSGFARTWDVCPAPDHGNIVYRTSTEEQDWNARMMRFSRPVGPTTRQYCVTPGDGVVTGSFTSFEVRPYQSS